MGSYSSVHTHESTFAVVGNQVYYVDYPTLYRLGSSGSENLNPNGETTSIHVAGDKGEYLVAAFEETAGAKYRLMVFDQSGKVVFKTADVMESQSTPTIEGKTLYFYSKTTGSLCKVTF